MTIMISVPTTLEDNLREAAHRQRVSPEQMAVQILEDALADDALPTLEGVVASIKALPRRPENIRPAIGSLRDLLAADPEDAEFDLEAWQHEWAKVEEEMRAITLANDIAEGFYPLP